MTTVLDLITNAFAEFGQYAVGETVPSADAAFALARLNRMLDNWSTRQLYSYCSNEVTVPFGTSKQSYTIGRSAADFDYDRPVKIEDARLVLISSTPYVYIPLDVMNMDEYSDLRVPGLSSSIPTRLYYQATYPNGTLWPWPYPTTVTNMLHMHVWNKLASLASLSAVISLAPGYEEAVTLSLAERLCPAFGKQISQDLKDQARKARADIQSLNSEPNKLKTDYPESAGQAQGTYLTGWFK